MKKLILSALVVGSLLATSCKETKEAGKDLKDATTEAATTVADGAKEGANAVADGAKDLATKATESVKSAIEGVTIPEFKDPKVGAYLKEYSEYAKEYIDAGKDVAKNSELMKKGTDLAAKTADVVKDLDAEASQKFSKVMAAIQSKMAPAK